MAISYLDWRLERPPWETVTLQPGSDSGALRGHWSVETTPPFFSHHSGLTPLDGAAGRRGRWRKDCQLLRFLAYGACLKRTCTPP